MCGCLRPKHRASHACLGPSQGTPPPHTATLSLPALPSPPHLLTSLSGTFDTRQATYVPIRAVDGGLVMDRAAKELLSSQVQIEAPVSAFTHSLTTCAVHALLEPYMMAVLKVRALSRRAHGAWCMGMRGIHQWGAVARARLKTHCTMALLDPLDQACPPQPALTGPPEGAGGVRAADSQPGGRYHRVLR